MKKLTIWRREYRKMATNRR